MRARSSSLGSMSPGRSCFVLILSSNCVCIWKYIGVKLLLSKGFRTSLFLSGAALEVSGFAVAGITLDFHITPLIFLKAFRSCSFNSRIRAAENKNGNQQDCNS